MQHPKPRAIEQRESELAGGPDSRVARREGGHRAGLHTIAPPEDSDLAAVQQRDRVARIAEPHSMPGIREHRHRRFARERRESSVRDPEAVHDAKDPRATANDGDPERARFVCGKRLDFASQVALSLRRRQLDRLSPIVAPDSLEVADPENALGVAMHAGDLRGTCRHLPRLVGDVEQPLVIRADPHGAVRSGRQRDTCRAARQLHEVELVRTKAVETAIRCNPDRPFAILENRSHEIAGQALLGAERLDSRLRRRTARLGRSNKDPPLKSLGCAKPKGSIAVPPRNEHLRARRPPLVLPGRGCARRRQWPRTALFDGIRCPNSSVRSERELCEIDPLLDRLEFRLAP